MDSQSTEFDSQQTIKDMPDSFVYYAIKNEKQKLEECKMGEVQDISHFITPRLPKFVSSHPQPCAIKRKRTLDLTNMTGDELIKHDPFFFDDIECDDKPFNKSPNFSKQSIPKIPKIKRKSLVLVEVK